jgi:MFS transporter, DHA1 family, tetracycline resistance protein
MTGKILPYAIVVLFAYIGFSLPLPLLPEMFLNPERSIVAQLPFQEKVIALGLMMASFPCGQFFGAPIVGNLSDRFGRKKIVLFSLAGTTLGYLITAFSVSQKWFWGMFIGLTICGFCEGNITIAQSVVVDLANDQERKARQFGILNIFISLGFIIGPLMGGLLGDPAVLSWFTFSTPFYAAACMTVIGMAIIYLCSSETLKEKKEGAQRIFSSIWKEIKRPKLSKLYLANFCLALGFFSYFRFMPVMLKERFDFSPSFLSYVMVYSEMAMILSVLCIVPVLARKFACLNILGAFASLLGCALIALVLPYTPYALWATIPLIGMTLGVTFTNGALLISNAASADFQGQALGTLVSVQVLAEAVTGIFGGMIASEQASLPLIAGAIMSVLCTALLLFNKRSLYV